MDEDLQGMRCEELVEEIIRLRDAIRRHRDGSGHELCWYHPQLWSLLPETAATPVTVPDWAHFMEGCVRYRASLDRDLPDAPRTGEEFTPEE